MTKQPSAENLINENDLMKQNELIHYDDYINARMGANSREQSPNEIRAMGGIANSTSLPNLNPSRNNSPNQNA